MAKRPKFYVVWKGHKPGVYETWEQCQEQIAGYSGRQYKAFSSREAAQRAFRGDYEQFVGQDTKTFRLTAAELEKHGVILDSVCVDAACSGNPGVLEYQGVDTASGLQLFHQGPFNEGTINIGEFLAIVHALALWKRKRRACPVYSDSQTAITWVREKGANTRLARCPATRRLFELIDRAENWLACNTYPNEILKWQTDMWGEIPADFGRK